MSRPMTLNREKFRPEDLNRPVDPPELVAVGTVEDAVTFLARGLVALVKAGYRPEVIAAAAIQHAATAVSIVTAGMAEALDSNAVGKGPIPRAYARAFRALAEVARLTIS